MSLRCQINLWSENTQRNKRHETTKNISRFAEWPKQQFARMSLKHGTTYWNCLGEGSKQLWESSLATISESKNLLIKLKSSLLQFKNAQAVTFLRVIVTFITAVKVWSASYPLPWQTRFAVIKLTSHGNFDWLKFSFSCQLDALLNFSRLVNKLFPSRKLDYVFQEGFNRNLLLIS